MTGQMDGKSSTSWLRRALAEQPRSSGEAADAGAAVNPHAGKTRDGCDPWGVWLRFLEQPRRMRRRDDTLE